MDYIRCEDVKVKLDVIKKEIEKIETMKRKLPEGELLCCKNEKRYKWFWKVNGSSTYLPKRNRQLAEKLALKKYFKYRLEELKTSLSAYEYYLKKMSGVEGKTETLLLHEEWSKLLATHFRAVNVELQRWQEEDYEKCEKYKENLIYKGTQGKMLRSKSEVIIDMMLYKNNIPFRYEDRLTLDGIEVYPDFTIRHPVTGKIIYWEHFGLMDEEVYRNSACSKIKLYCDNGIIPSVDLITTYETKLHPLDIGHVEAIIKEYFLP
ncbi:MAG: ATPase [Lachnospira sp.]